VHSLKLPWPPSSPLNVLCLGAHSDDIEIGCGGTVLRLADQYPHCVFHWVVFSAAGARAAEAERSAARFVGGPTLRTTIRDFRDGCLDFYGPSIKTLFEDLKTVSPDLILTHQRKDAHQDHRLIAELTWNTFRHHLILEYEIPKYDGDMGQPNVFFALEQDLSHKKVELLLESFPSQRNRYWFKEELFLALMRLRGMECRSDTGYAEAFYCRKLLL